MLTAGCGPSQKLPRPTCGSAYRGYSGPPPFQASRIAPAAMWRTIPSNPVQIAGRRASASSTAATARGLPKEPSGPDGLYTAFLGTPGSLLAPTGGAIPSRLQNQIHRPAPTSSLKPVTHAPDRLNRDPMALEPRLLTIADIPALAAYCVAYARWRGRRSPGFARGTR